MRGLFIFLLSLALSGAAWGESVTIHKGFAKVREKPSVKARPIDLVYGNDAMEVLEKTKGWFQVRTTAGRVGWISEHDLLSGLDSRAFARPATKALMKATLLQRLGYRKQARRKLVQVIRRYPGTYEYYEAVRHMLYYHPAGKLAKPETTEVGEEALARAGKLAVAILGKEGEKLIGEKRYLEAVSLYEGMQAGDTQQRAPLAGIHRALKLYLDATQTARNLENLGMAAVAYKKYFPTQPIPQRIAALLRAQKPAGGAN